MLPAQLKETTMDPQADSSRSNRDVDFEGTRDAVDSLMGTKAEARFRFIQERAFLRTTWISETRDRPHGSCPNRFFHEQAQRIRQIGARGGRST